jgi:hypothetical protein
MRKAMSRFAALVWAFLTAGTLLNAVPAAAQSATTGAIAGVVRDSTGALLPGVTVEASSPALIEKVRVAVSDEQGQYKILELRPGTYAVTFTLPGFATVRREGLELTTGFTATVNADLKVGALEETITVTGASPTVDTQNARTRTVLSREVQDALPTGTRSINAFGAITVAAKMAGTQDVGGNTGENTSTFGVHGSSGADSRLVLDGMAFSAIGSGGVGVRHYQINNMAVEEVTVTTRGSTAETEGGGPYINNVPKEGSNAFRVTVTISGASSAMQSDKLTDTLRTRGVTSAPSIRKVWDYGVAAGGPVKQDRLWFFLSTRYWGAENYQPGSYWANKTDPAALGGRIYVADLSRPGYTSSPQVEGSGRLTWQATPKQKVNAFVSKEYFCNCFIGVSAARSPEATAMLRRYPLLMQGKWVYPATSKLFFEAGVAVQRLNLPGERPEGVGATDIPYAELSTGLRYNALAGPTLVGAANIYGQYTNHTANELFSVSYVTGSHAFKAGVTNLQGWQDFDYDYSPIEHHFRLGRPAAIVEWAMPLGLSSRIESLLGVFAQDQWTRNKLTLNLGVRFDYNHGFNPGIELPAGPFVPARTFPAGEGVNWKDISPRIGAAYDLFGDGKTAIKGTLGRFVSQDNWSTTRALAPSLASTLFATRAWNDLNGDFVPDCNLSNPLANGECATLSDLGLGSLRAATAYAGDVATGWFNRLYSWQSDVTVQHELLPRVAVMAGYYRTWYGNVTVTDNTAVRPSDFDRYCITAPADARLPGGGGYQVCDLYDINPAKFGQVSRVVKQSSEFGSASLVTNGFDLAMRAQFGRGGLIQGGIASDRSVSDYCLEGLGATPMAPQPAGGTTGIPSTDPSGGRVQPASQCRTVLPLSKDLQLKLSGVYPLPWGLEMSGVFQNLPGFSNLATYNAPNAAIAPSLGRSLAGNAATAAVGLIEPYTMFEDRVTQLDLRFTKLLQLNRARVRAHVDLYNAFNARTILSTNTTVGPAWLRPTNILGGRLVRLGGQVDF